MYRLFFTILLPVLAVMTASPAMASSDPPPPPKTVVEECTDNWNSSSASNTCSNASIVKVMNYRCRITADCRNSGGGTGSTWKTVERDEANRLVNCNGTLKLDNC